MITHDTKTETYTVTIKQKPNASAFEVASKNFDIELEFPKRINYAVICPAYYNIAPKMSRMRKNAINEAKKLKNLGYSGVRIVDFGGNLFEEVSGKLELCGEIEDGIVKEF